ncbi:beta-glucosidase 11-like [Gossypium australe]|uniref:Beta-glucosidase 11-like n=1 Tax=Gossypium australe TaxID=47621 RepID=A0A5B6V9C2_9ROSI|nr:beta-glucosidase 11-like [Gossypium australe]
MSAIMMKKNPDFHAQSKHIELHHHFIRDLVNNGEICLKFVRTNKQPVDVLTKPVSLEKLEKFKDSMKITN